MSTCFSFPLGTMLLGSLDFLRVQFFQNWNWGMGTGNKVPGHCIFSWATGIFASRYSRYFIHVSKSAYHIICQGFTDILSIFKKFILLYLFLSRLYILVQLYFIKRMFSFRFLSILALSLLILFLTIFHEDVIPFFWRKVSITYRPKVEKK